MALWDTVTNIATGGGKEDANRGYDAANNYMNPYYMGGQNSYRQLQDYMPEWNSRINGMNNPTDGYGNPADSRWRNANQSPTDYYKNIMNDYNESPDAKYAQEQALRASNAGASASGMLGSGAQLKALQQNANDISQRDRQQYFDNIMGSNNAQMRNLENFQGEQHQFNNRQDQQRAMYQQMMQYLTSLGYNAGNTMGENEVNRGNANAKFDQQAIDDFMSLIGAGSQSYSNSGGLSGNASRGG